MDFKEYIKELDQLYQVGNTTEHSFRGSLANYLQSMLPKFVITNEPRRIDCGAPDYVITQNNQPIAFLEAKDINDGDLDGRKEHKEQFNRYKESLNRVIFTDYLDFHLYLEGEFVDSVRIAETRGNRIVGLPENEAKFVEMVTKLADGGRQKITSSSALARQMAAKAHLLAEAVKKTIELDGEDGEREVSTQLRAFREVLIHDLKAEEFADIYAQTIVYGMFTARLYDSTPEDFSRQEAAELIPKSNPFLRKIFQSIAVYDLDDSIAWIVDDLAAMFQYTDAEKIMKNYGSNKRHSDPIVHFYEDFLAEYDPKLRKARGVWYTPSPVVKFIVKSVDEILQQEFGLARGLADDSKVLMDVSWEQSRDKRFKDGMKHEKVEVPRVQILDPATGTGTFLAEVIEQIRDKFNGFEGLWPSYVEKNLIPRIHGFEILMASYTIAHLKLALTLKNTGYDRSLEQRLNVFLTNSLEEATPRSSTLFSKWLSDEADAASEVKLKTPIMIAIGNPPYSISSQNSGKWITDLVADYKKNLNERNIQPLSDDYIKFIRLGQYYIEKNGEGILAYISNNGFLDGVIHRQMRKSLLEVFDKIYVLDLHGDNRRKEHAPDGSSDENVFDILQGVSINIFVKTREKASNSLAQIYHADLFGSREGKYSFLNEHSICSTTWSSLSPIEPYWFFSPKDFSAEKKYKQGLSISDFFVMFKPGVATGKDDVLVNSNEGDLQHNVEMHYGITVDTSLIHSFCYRPFDVRKIYYDTSLVQRHREPLMRHLIKDNTALIVASKNRQLSFNYYMVTNHITDRHYLDFADTEYDIPLYLHLEEGKCISNFKEEVLQNYSDIIGSPINPEELFSYIYAWLYCPKYHYAFKEFLKIDFPYIPFPKDAQQYFSLSKKGAELRKLHLMENTASWNSGVGFPVAGSNTVEKVSFEDGKVFINAAQYFSGVPELAWNFFIGGFQPAQKWLKDRKGRTLEYEDILHYGRIIYALQETDRLMKEIDAIIVENQ